jgi:hypothetical protein
MTGGPVTNRVTLVPKMRVVEEPRMTGGPKGRWGLTVGQLARRGELASLSLPPHALVNGYGASNQAADERARD